jgi:hypothetical protein
MEVKFFYADRQLDMMKLTVAFTVLQMHVNTVLLKVSNAGCYYISNGF